MKKSYQYILQTSPTSIIYLYTPYINCKTEFDILTLTLWHPPQVQNWLIHELLHDILTLLKYELVETFLIGCGILLLYNNIRLPECSVHELYYISSGIKGNLIIKISPICMFVRSVICTNPKKGGICPPIYLGEPFNSRMFLVPFFRKVMCCL